MESIKIWVEKNQDFLEAFAHECRVYKKYAMARVVTLLPLAIRDLPNNYTIGDVVRKIIYIASNCNWTMHNSGWNKDNEYQTVRNNLVSLAKQYGFRYRTKYILNPD